MKAPSKHAYRPTSPHSPNQQIHAYKNSNVNKICVADIRFFRSVESCFCLIHHFHIAHMHLPSCLAPSHTPLPPPPGQGETMVAVNKVY